MKQQNIHFKTITLLLSLFVISFIHAQDRRSDKLSQKADKRLSKYENVFQNWGYLGNMDIDSVEVNDKDKVVKIFFNTGLSYMPVREGDVNQLDNELKSLLRHKFKDYKVEPITGNYPFEQMIPNYYRETVDVDKLRLLKSYQHKSVVRNVDQPVFEKGLSQNNIALWHSHGYYFEHKLNRWEWQRARLYTTVEDLLPMSFVLPYLAPMLENSGAYVLMPRERDFQINEVVVDDDRCSAGSKFELDRRLSSNVEKGFAPKDTLFPRENPFEMGTSLSVKSGKDSMVARYTPYIPKKGSYAVYISYISDESNSESVVYKVHHSGGVSSFEVNQTMGGSTWIYLGQFLFEEGFNPEWASVEVSGKGKISVDAVRFGGGMGNIARRAHTDDTWKLSGKPRYTEAARYWMQYAGMPDSLVFSFNKEQKDYKDDYMSRGEWLNYLMGAPNGPNLDRDNKGLGIPIDVALAFHTDAGVTPNDSIIGTLGIYSSVRDEGLLPNGQSRLVSRDLADVVISQVVSDISELYNPEWTRRAMWDKQYSEAWRPHVPTLLLELLSHQNLADMQLALDPKFRFDVSRAVYKGLLKFLAYQENREYTVQPLPVDHLAIQKINDGYRISWQAVDDPLELSAKPEYYKVYQRNGDGGFDNGIIVNGNSYFIESPKEGEILSFKVTALNNGGESMPSEVLALGVGESNDCVLVVNAFDRVSAPEMVDGNVIAGVASWEDEGVADGFDYSYTGQQYDFDRNSPWLDDDSPGWGSSYGDEEGKPRPGNSFDFAFVHGQAILDAGYSFVSISDEAFAEQNTSLNQYYAVDCILGEEKPMIRPNQNTYEYSIFTAKFINRLQQATDEGVSLLLSGAYVGTDLKIREDSVAMNFANHVLGFQWRTNHACRNGKVSVTDKGSRFFNDELKFNTGYDPVLYKVESPDAIEPDSEAQTVLRYSENQLSAGVFLERDYKVLILGFPFESIQTLEMRSGFMKAILEAFKAKKSE